MELLKRVAVSVVSVPIIVAVVSTNSYWRDIFLIVLAIGGYLELSKFTNCLRNKRIKLFHTLFYSLSALVLLTDISRLFLEKFSFGFHTVLILVLAFCFLLEFIISKPENEGFHARISKLIFPFIYILFPIALFRQGASQAFNADMGVGFSIFLLAMVWINDSFAYFVGRLFGKKKLMEEVSPKKTVEGFVGAMIFTLVASVVWHTIYPFIGLLDMLVLAFMISLTGPAGDLFESALKRDCGVKDCSNVIPGHGGILDRFDSFIFSIPLYYLYFSIIIF